MTKKVIYVTGSRAEYGVMRNLLQLINVTPGFDLSLIITGMHTSKKHGNTIQEILQDKLTIRATINQKPITTVADMARSLGELICEITDILEEDKPDIILLAGDRNEALAGAIAGAHMNTLVAHISGGISHPVAILMRLHVMLLANMPTFTFPPPRRLPIFS